MREQSEILCQPAEVLKHLRGLGSVAWQPCRGWGIRVLCAVAQQVIRQHTGHHRFADWDGADAHAGVVPAFGHDLDIMAEAIDRLARRQD
jgi:hypothetical protein